MTQDCGRACARLPKVGARVTLRLNYIPQEEMTQLLAAADVVVLPFRRITTSGSAVLALSHGRPLIVPNLATLADLPDAAVFRYDGGIPALTDALAHLARADSEMLAAMSAAASSHATKITWHEIAERTMTEMLYVLGDVPRLIYAEQQLAHREPELVFKHTHSNMIIYADFALAHAARIDPTPSTWSAPSTEGRLSAMSVTMSFMAEDLRPKRMKSTPQGT